jgi:hypothetical protein
MTREEIQRDLGAEVAESMERLRFSVEIAKTGLQSLTVVNGGALIALFTLIGTGRLAFALLPLWLAFASFVLGVAASQTAFIYAFISQDKFYHVAARRALNHAARLANRAPEEDEKTPFDEGNKALAAAERMAGASIILFIVGAGLALAAFT